jgi:hypothetical protein
MNPAPDIDPMSIDDCSFTCREIYEHAIYAQIQQIHSGLENSPNNPSSSFLSQPRGLILMEAGN